MNFSCGLIFSLTTFLLIGCAGTAPLTNNDTLLTVMSYNLRFDNPDDGENRWDNRKEQAAALIAFHQPDFLGTQEGLLHQLEYLDDKLDDYGRIGVARDDGDEQGEFSALFFNETKFELVEDSEQTIWLSETPDEPSKSWDAALPRILTYGKFRDRQTDDEFWVFNTHFDHLGDTARTESAKLIIETIEEAGEEPAILMGDFNVTDEMEPYKVLTADDSPMKDAYHVTQKPHVGPDFTFEGFEAMSEEDKNRIDYIFVNNRFVVQNHAILTSFRDGRYPSDHLPVVAKVKIE